MTRTVAQLIQPQSPQPSASRVLRRRTALSSSVLAFFVAQPRASRAGLFTKSPSADFVEYDAPELDYSFAHPKKWLVLRNRLRAGAIASDFDTQDKASVEVLKRWADTEACGFICCKLSDAVKEPRVSVFLFRVIQALMYLD